MSRVSQSASSGSAVREALGSCSRASTIGLASSTLRPTRATIFSRPSAAEIRSAGRDVVLVGTCLAMVVLTADSRSGNWQMAADCASGIPCSRSRTFGTKLVVYSAPR